MTIVVLVLVDDVDAKVNTALLKFVLKQPASHAVIPGARSLLDTVERASHLVDVLRVIRGVLLVPLGLAHEVPLLYVGIEEGRDQITLVHFEAVRVRTGQCEQCAYRGVPYGGSHEGLIVVDAHSLPISSGTQAGRVLQDLSKFIALDFESPHAPNDGGTRWGYGKFPGIVGHEGVVFLVRGVLPEVSIRSSDSLPVAVGFTGILCAQHRIVRFARLSNDMPHKILYKLLPSKDYVSDNLYDIVQLVTRLHVQQAATLMLKQNQMRVESLRVLYDPR